MEDAQTESLLELTAGIVAAYVGNSSSLKAEEIPEIIRTVHMALKTADAPPAAAEPKTAKADKRAIAKSITPDGLISFIDGKSYKTLKRHLGVNGHDMKSYREAFGLPTDYPSVAASYSASRSAMAKSIGLGARSKTKAAPAASADAPAKRGRGRPKAAKS